MNTDTEHIARCVSLELELEPPLNRFDVLGLNDVHSEHATRAALQQRYGRETAERIVTRVESLSS